MHAAIARLLLIPATALAIACLPHAAVADVVSLDKYRPLFARVQALAEGCDDTEMAIGIDLMNFALRVYAQLKLSAADSLKGLLESLGSFFGGGRRATATAP